MIAGWHDNGSPIGARCDEDVGGRPCGEPAPFSIGLSARRGTMGRQLCSTHWRAEQPSAPALPVPATKPAQGNLLL